MTVTIPAYVLLGALRRMADAPATGAGNDPHAGETVERVLRGELAR
jgi:hypothetical protein